MCGIPTTVPHARHSASVDQLEFEIDSQVSYICFPGYESRGFSTAKCMFYNNTAQWLGPDLKCIRKLFSFVLCFHEKVVKRNKK
jgi:hypothetical protein